VAQAVVTLLNKVGLHARTATLFVQLASEFNSNVVVKKDGKEANAKSILDVLSLGAEHGDVIGIEADGDDGEKAVETLVELVKNRFYEE